MAWINSNSEGHFLLLYRFNLEDEKLNNISMSDRKIVSQKYKAEIGKLDDISEKLFSYGTEEDGWKNVLDYIKKIFGD